jgi:hypothetical protein
MSVELNQQEKVVSFFCKEGPAVVLKKGDFVSDIRADLGIEETIIDCGPTNEPKRSAGAFNWCLKWAHDEALIELNYLASAEIIEATFASLKKRHILVSHR